MARFFKLASWCFEMGTRQSLLNELRRFVAGSCGAAAAEFALVLPLLTVPILNIVDLGSYAYDRMQLDNAAQAAVQAVWNTCATQGYVPATTVTNCSSVLSSITTTSAQSTALGTSVTISSTTEGYYCLVSGTLTYAGAVTATKPSDCSVVAGGSSSDTPGDYILVTAAYTYSPIFSAASLVSLLPSSMTRTAYMRLS
jgi:Flp pilus assembly protein TadG